jgi:hypothetical protein
MLNYLRTKPLSRATDATCGTTGTAFERPTDIKAFVCRVLLAAEGYVGFGEVVSPIPAAAVGNTVYQASGTTDYYFDDAPSPAYVYVYAPSGTIVVKVSWLG